MSTNWPSLYDPSVDLLRIPHNDPVQPTGHYLTHAQDVFRFTLYWTLIFYLPLFVLAGSLAFFNIIFPPNRHHRSDRSNKSAYLDAIGDNDSSTHRQQGDSSASEMYPLAPLTSAGSAFSAASPTTAYGYYPASPSSQTGTGYAALVPKSGPDSGPPASPAPEAHRPSISNSVPQHASIRTARTQSRAPQNLQQVNPRRTRITYALLVLFLFLFSGLLGAVVGSAIVGYVLAGLYQAGGFHMSTWIPPVFALVQTLIGVLGIYPSIADII